MSAQVTSRSPNQGIDELDDLFDYDPNLNDIFGDTNASKTPKDHATEQRPLPNRSIASEGLGIDEEITIVNKRQPIAKLDDTRLLSDLGIPKLRKIAKKRKGFKGKGHEFSDVSRILAMYQLWLDQLYPRAKFSDGLAMIEKLGHSKRMAVMRKQWIDEGRPERISEAEHTDADARNLNVAAESMTQSGGRVLEDDQYNDGEEAHEGQTASGARRNDDGEPQQDELDMLLAENANALQGENRDLSSSRVAQDEFEDEMEAIADIGDMW